MVTIKNKVKRLPLIGGLLRRIYGLHLKSSFTNSKDYWENRYSLEGSSGDGSYNELAKFKADVLNNFVKENNINTVVEFGCGDGNQLTLSEYKQYIGFDVSAKAVSICRNMYSEDKTKKFMLMREWEEGLKEQLCLSLDVIYHLVEDEIYEDYMEKLFKSSNKYVVIYSSNREVQEEPLPHVRQRKFTDWIKNNAKQWRLLKKIDNKYSYDPGKNFGSISDFYIFMKTST